VDLRLQQLTEPHITPALQERERAKDAQHTGPLALFRLAPDQLI